MTNGERRSTRAASPTASSARGPLKNARPGAFVSAQGLSSPPGASSKLVSRTVPAAVPSVRHRSQNDPVVGTFADATK